MRTQATHVGDLLAEDIGALLNGLRRSASHVLTGRIEAIASACDVAGLLADRRAARLAGSRLYRAAEREGHRIRNRGGVFGCFRYLSELT